MRGGIRTSTPCPVCTTDALIWYLIWRNRERSFLREYLICESCHTQFWRYPYTQYPLYRITMFADDDPSITFPQYES